MEQKRTITYATLIAIPILLGFCALLIGRYGVGGKDAFHILWSLLSGDARVLDEKSTLVITEIRLPRIIASMIVGASLAVSGAAFQGLFCNPLVNSGILGVSAGAGFGAALSILLIGQGSSTFIMAFLFGCAAVAMSYFTGRAYGTTSTIMLVLGGTVVSSIFSALISFLKYIADPYNQLPAITFWLMGSMASVSIKNLIPASLPMLIGITGLFVLRWRLNVLSMGDLEAQALGINVPATKGAIIVFATLSTAGAVCISGIVGWVGLIIPHIARMILGSDNKIVIPASISLGAGFMVVVDTMSRSMTGSEIPLGIITAILGGPFFIYLLKKTKGGGW